MANPLGLVHDDYYAILQVDSRAPISVIRESFRKLALQKHPDKNRGDANATAAFQRLAKAWETLSDEARRRDYDLGLGGLDFGRAKRKWDEDVDEAAEMARRRTEQVDRDARARWTAQMEMDRAGPPVENPEQQKAELERRQKARAFRAVAREDYLSRLQVWADFRRKRCGLMVDCQRLIGKLQKDLHSQTREDEEEVVARFNEAIERSRSAGTGIADNAVVLEKLLEARENYLNRLAKAIHDARMRLDQMIVEVEDHRRRYEEEEAQARRRRIQEALEILGPRGLNPPLFSVVDRRGQAINLWKALSRVKCPINFPLSLQNLSEGPWHQVGEWERMVGEHDCERCGCSTFQLVPECAAAKCPGCGMVTCNSCCRDLLLLREYAKWVTSVDGDGQECLFSLDFDWNAKVRECCERDYGGHAGHNIHGNRMSGSSHM